MAMIRNLDRDLVHFSGSAHWIWSQEGVWGGSSDPRPVQVRWFSRTFTRPAGCRVELALSADTRYLLFVNGKLVARGPQKGDVAHQFYDEFDLSAETRDGENLLLVRVDGNAKSFPYFGHTGPSASEMSAACLFVADGSVRTDHGVVVESLASDDRWRVLVDPSLAFAADAVGSYTGYKETMDLTRLPKGFFQGASVSTWAAATLVHQAVRPDTALDPFLPHRLVPRTLPPMRESAQGFTAIRRGIGQLSGGRYTGRFAAGERYEVLLDAGQITTAYPLLSWTGGHGARLTLHYAECVMVDGKKSHRDRIDGQIVGHRDIVTLSRDHHEWQPLHWRAFRYILVSLEIADEALELTELSALNCHYPLDEPLSLRCSDPMLERCWKVGLQTQRACAHDTFEDCPFYEQLQYAGDAQMQMAFVCTVFGDTRLARQAIRFFHWSRLPEGITQSRYPSRPTQVIPSWSLHYVLMLHDWWQWTGDALSIREEAIAAVSVIRWFLDRRDASGLVGALPYWCVADWSPEWVRDFGGNIPGVKDGPCALINLQVIAASEALAEVLGVLGEDASALRDAAKDLRRLVQRTFWMSDRGVYGDIPGNAVASQLTNAWALLLNLPEAAARSALAQRMADDKALCQTAFFGDFWLFEAWRQAGRADLVRSRFDAYLTLLDQGVTTWPEDPSQGRSDCHAWSNAATFHLLRTVLGMVSTAPGCTRITVAPQLGGLTAISGATCTPRGPLLVAIEQHGISLTVPPGTTVDLLWRQKAHVVGPGRHQITF